MSKLNERTSRHIAPGTAALTEQQIGELLQEAPHWTVEGKTLTRSFKFDNYYETMSFVVAVAMLAHREDHHPEMHVGYNKLTISYSTHSVGGLSENDFICAAKINGLMAWEG
ncbi:MAG TPA: 4a-hydroxytetrahydrobiopterin dehydratase [Tepidisphaeraceae bacterium]